MSRKITIIIADDHAMLRDGLKMVLRTEASFEIAGEAADGEAAVDLALRLRPDVIIMDINMPVLNGIEAVRKMRMLDVKSKILMLTMHESSNYILDAVSAGINGYVLKNSDMEELINAVRTLGDGSNFFPPNVSQVLLKNIIEQNQPSFTADTEVTLSSLTRREREIISLIVKGMTSQEISERLFISYYTVGQHRKNIMQKLQLKNSAELVRFALEKQLS